MKDNLDTRTVGKDEALVCLGTGTPTISSQVTSRTPLDQLNLNWRESDLAEKDRTKHVHRLHPYLGKFIPQLVEVFLRKYFRPGQTVFDPFCGSGTTLVQANELGIDSIGCDISAFNVLLCKTKLSKVNLKQLEKETFDILEHVRTLTQHHGNQKPLWNQQIHESMLTEVNGDYVKNWFAPKAMQELKVYRALIEQRGYRYKNILKIILSRSARSARLTTHFDLDFPKQPQKTQYWCYKHSRECSPTQEAFKFLKRYSIDTLRRFKEFDSHRTDAKVSVRNRDSRIVPLPLIDGIITSPPYVGLIDYHEQHAYAYHLLGLKDKRRKEIGPGVKGSSQRAQGEYKDQITEVFHNAMKSLRPGGKIIVIANDKFDLYSDIAGRLRVKTEAIIRRHVNRRTGRRKGNFYESIFVWQKMKD